MARVVLLCLTFQAQGQEDVSKGFKLLFYQRAPGKNLEYLKSQITGAEARPQANGLDLVTKVRIEEHLPDGKTNLIAVAPECLVDTRRRIAFSTNRLEVETADGQLRIQGQGFFYQQTNFNLTISNQVATTIHRELIRSTNILMSPLPLLAGTNAPPGSNQVIKIFSDHFDLESSSNLAIYTGNARVDDPQVVLTSESLTLRRSTNGPLESIVADRNVAMTNKLDQSRATGDRAVYSLEPDTEWVVLTGHAAHWQEGERDGKGGRFTFDRRANTVRAEEKPWVRLPRSAISQPLWLGGKPADPNPGVLTNQFVEITAGEMLIQLPTTNQPSRRLTAQANVVILSPADDSRASSDRAFYDEATGTAELTGHAVWQAGERLVKGETLLFARTNNLFSAKGNAYLRVPLSALGRPTRTGQDLKKPSLPEAVEVFSSQLFYQPDALTFEENVRANYFRGEARQGWLSSGFLSLGLNSNRLESVVARRSVVIEVPALGTNEARRADKKLNCEYVTIHFYSNGLVRSVFAETNVLAQQNEMRPGHDQPVHSELSAQHAQMFLFAHTNEVREVVAEENVSIGQDTRKAHGDRAVYTATNHTAVLTGHPTAEMPMGRIIQAEALVWDQARDALVIKGKKIIGGGDLPSKGTNRFFFRK